MPLVVVPSGGGLNQTFTGTTTFPGPTTIDGVGNASFGGFLQSGGYIQSGGGGAIATGGNTNNLQMNGSATGVAARLSVVGADASVGLTIQTRNAGGLVNALSISGPGLVSFPVGITAALDNTYGSQVFYGQAIQTGLAVGNSNAVIKLDSSTAAFKNDATHDFQSALTVNNYTKSGAGIVVGNNGNGDGIYVQTIDTTGTAYAINVFAGNPTNLTAVGAGVNIQRYGTGQALRIVGNGTSATELVMITQNANGRTIFVPTDASTTADTFACTATGKTSGGFFNFYHANSAMTGPCVRMNLGNGTGSFLGNFLDFKVNGVAKLTVNYNGSPGFFGVAPPAQAAAIASPTSDALGTKAAIDAIRVALQSYGLTL